MILVSACLLGHNYKYNGGNNFSPQLTKLLEGKKVMAVCPEVAGGLSTPRPPAEIIKGDGFDVLAGRALVKNIKGEDVTAFYLAGAAEILNGIDPEQVEFAILKEKSPSCGSGQIYSGQFNNRLIEGRGVGAAYLLERGIPVYSEKDLSKLMELLSDETGLN